MNNAMQKYLLGTR